MTATMTFDELAHRLAPAKGWHADPHGHHHLRYHDGDEWTEHVTHFGPIPCQSCGTER